MCDAIDVILSMQNADGGFASYELIRGAQFLELLNPAEVSEQVALDRKWAHSSSTGIREHYDGVVLP